MHHVNLDETPWVGAYETPPPLILEYFLTNIEDSQTALAMGVKWATVANI